MVDRMSRRIFLGRATAAAAVIAGCGMRPRFDPSQGGSGRGLLPRELKTLAAAQDIILPSAPDSPGAKDVRAAAYLDAALSYGAERGAGPRVRHGLLRLDELAAPHGVEAFWQLDRPQAEAILEAFIAAEEGWFVLVLGFTLEALLGDPVHGGNPEGIGWSWLGHSPGWPRPEARATAIQ